MAQTSANLRKIWSLRQIVELPVWETISRSIQQQREWVDRVHIELTEIPAPTFHEAARAEYMAERFRQLGLKCVRLDSHGNLLGERPGMDGGFIGITAHLDTVVLAGTPVEVSRIDGRFRAPGISDNGAGLAALLGTAAALQESNVATDLSLLFVSTVGEEGEGDLYGMRGLFARQEICRRAKGVVVLDGSSIQQTAIAGLGSRRYLVEVSGPGGHSWSDFGRVNPIHVLSDAIGELKKISLPTAPKTSLSIGVIHGGSVVNAIPNSAWMKLDIRSTNPEEIRCLSLAVETAVQGALEAENRRGCGRLEARIVPIGDRPAAELSPSARILQVIQEVDQHLGIKGRFEASSTDANIPLALGIEAITTGGGGTGGDAHTPNEWYDPRGRDLGLKRILLTVLALAGIIDEP